MLTVSGTTVPGICGLVVGFGTNDVDLLNPGVAGVVVNTKVLGTEAGMYGFGVVINDGDGVFGKEVEPGPGVPGLGVLTVSVTTEAGMYGLGVVTNDNGGVFCVKVDPGGPVFVVPVGNVPTDPGMYGLGVVINDDGGVYGGVCPGMYGLSVVGPAGP